MPRFVAVCKDDLSAGRSSEPVEILRGRDASAETVGCSKERFLCASAVFSPPVSP